MVNRKQNQYLKTIVLATLITGSLVGAGAYGYFSGTASPKSPTSSSASASSSSGNSDYVNLKNQVNVLNQKVRSNPNDSSLQQELGNAYYDLGTMARTVAPNEAREDYLQAIKYYQSVLNTKKDINVLTDMSTAAIYTGQNDVAEKGFKEALTENPDFIQALFNYGVFLSEIKKDYASAISVWQTALDKDPNGPNAERLKQIIPQAKDMLAAQQKSNDPVAGTSSNKTP